MPSPAPSTRPPSAANSSGSREKILEVAEGLFARSGFAGVGLREVADGAGLGKSSLFHHFRSKTQLYGEVLEGVLRRIAGRLEPVLARSSPPVERLDRSIEALVDALAEHPTSARLLLRALFEDDGSEGRTPPELQPAEDIVAELFAAVGRLLEEGVAQGVFRPVSVPDTLQSLIGASVYHFASAELGERLLGGPLFSAAAVARRRRELVDLFHRGIVAPQGDPS